MKIYLYGMICITTSFKLNAFPTPDEYSEIEQMYRFPGGETGTCGTVLSSLGADVIMDGTHIGKNSEQLVKDFYRNRSVDLSHLTFDGSFEGLEDYVIISGSERTPMGTFGHFFSDAFKNNIRHWNKPREDIIAECDTAAVDDCFLEDSELAARLCVKHGIPYVTIDCRYDGYLHKHSAVSVISGEGIENLYKGSTRKEMMEYYKENSEGLTIITNGGNKFYYGRKGQPVKSFMPFRVKVESTLGAGDTFKAGCTYALAAGMSDDELVRFASACAAAAVSHYPIQLAPPTLEEINDLILKNA